MRKDRVNRYFQLAILGLTYFLLSSALTLGQEIHHEHEEHNQHIGFLIGPVYNLHEKSLSPGFGIEYERVLPIWDHLAGIGVGAEAILDEQKHYVVFISFPFHITRELTFKFAPGAMFIEKEEWESRFAFHFGLSYEFELDRIFLAPALELGIAGDDIHLCWAFTSAGDFRSPLFWHSSCFFI